MEFTMKIKGNQLILFLNILVHKGEDNSLGHTIYRKKTYAMLLMER